MVYKIVKEMRNSMIKNGADIVLECLLEQGVDTVFGYPGGAILNVYDAFYKYSGKIRHILTSHEQGAAHAADGYARSTGKVGVCVATSGPGATNLVTGIATAYMDSVPIVAITCNVANNLLGKDSFQEVDIVGITMPVTKHNFLIKSAEDIAPTFRRAFKIAASGRPGPVLIDITKDATAGEAEYKKEIPERIDNYKLESDSADFDEVIGMIEKSERPFILAGGGIIAAGAAKQLHKFQKTIDAPVALATMGLGAFPASDPAFTGMIGMHGTKTSSLAIKHCDLLINIGSRFSDRVICNPKTFARRAKIVHIDVDRAEINKNIFTDAHLIGDAAAVLDELNKRLHKQKHTEWMGKISGWKEKYPMKYSGGGEFNPETIIKEIKRQAGDDSYLVTDVGQHQMWAAQFYGIEKPRHFLSSGGLGTMGYGVGAAIGAQSAHPDSVVVNISGDGCFHMNLQELSTAATQKLPIIDVIMNNNVLGMVRQWQRLFYGERFSQTTLNKPTDYDMVSKGLGANAFTVTNMDELKHAVSEALKTRNKPTVINCVINQDHNVLPMVPGGESIEEPILEITTDGKEVR